MFRKNYKVETIITLKNGTKYTTTKIQKMTKKEAIKLNNTTKVGVNDITKDYKWIVYNVKSV